jgi:HlyD family secretion protein
LRQIKACRRRRAYRDGMQSRLKFGLAALVGLVAVAAAVLWITHRTPAPRYVTAQVTRGDVIPTITASGSVNPVLTVQVGTYVSGVIQTIACDYNTRVHKGQLCAKIDPAPYQIVVDQDRANLSAARAQLTKDRANLAYTKLNRERKALLFKQDSGSRDAADAALNADDQAHALVALDVAQVAERAAALKAAEINLNYTNIVSPVDGTVVSRNVTAGQTVAASFQTPTLFLIATDLTKMQVDTNVSESDIAGAAQGAGATFTVDAFPRRTFQGIVTQVRQAPVSVQNVITYDVVITVANPGFLLKPGMTATARIATARAADVLRVPSQALRFTPLGAAASGVGRAPGGARGAATRKRVVWVMRAGQPVAVPIAVGLDDDAFAEIRSGDLKLGDQIIVSQAGAGKATRPGRAPTASLRL